MLDYEYECEYDGPMPPVRYTFIHHFYIYRNNVDILFHSFFWTFTPAFCVYIRVNTPKMSIECAGMSFCSLSMVVPKRRIDSSLFSSAFRSVCRPHVPAGICCVMRRSLRPNLYHRTQSHFLLWYKRPTLV